MSLRVGDPRSDFGLSPFLPGLTCDAARAGRTAPALRQTRTARRKGKIMDIKLVVSDGKRIERVGRILLVARHRRACRALEEVVKERGGDLRLERSGRRDTRCWLSELRQ